MSIRIAHVDLDAFFVEVCRRDDLALRDVELLVVGGRRDSRGVVQSASYGARRYGVRSGMPIAEAVRRCPGATFVRGDFPAYRRASREVRHALEQHAPAVVMTGLDEGYLDLSGTDLLHPVSLLAYATTLRTTVREATGLDCSIGIGANCMIAKIASDVAKPRGICEVRPGWERGFLAGLPLAALPGIGPTTARRLADLGLAAVHQIQEMPLEELARRIGADAAHALQRQAMGHGRTTLPQREQPRSVSRETTFRRDVAEAGELDRVLLALVARVASQLRAEGLEGRAVTLKLRHGDFRTVTRRTTLDTPTARDDLLLGAARRLLGPAFAEARARGQAVRLLGVAATSLTAVVPIELFTDPAARRTVEVTRAVDQVRERFGFDAVRPGRLVRRPTTDD